MRDDGGDGEQPGTNQRDEDSAVNILINDGRSDAEPMAVPPPGSTSDEAHVAVIDGRVNHNRGTDEETAPSAGIESNGRHRDVNPAEENIDADEENAASPGDDDASSQPDAVGILPENAANEDNAANENNVTAIADLADSLGIPMVGAELVNPTDEEAGDDSDLVAVAQVSSPRQERTGESVDGDVVQAEPIHTVTVCGKTVQRSTAGFFGLMAAMVVVAVATAVPLAMNSNGGENPPAPVEIRAREARNQTRREVLVGILSPSIAQEGAFNDTGDGLNSTLSASHRVQALEWLADDFPANVSTATEMLDYYPEWKVRQRYILALLYFATGGPDWYAQLGFLSDEDECLWAGSVPRFQGHKNVVYSEDGDLLDDADEVSNEGGGLTCDEDGRVETITLGVNNLVGTIPPELSGLQESLTKLGLMRNTLSSTIPSSLSELKRLKTLNLLENCLTGVIPESLSELSTLSTARFRGNNDLRGNLNAFCDGGQYRENRFKKMLVEAECGDCPGSAALVECACCTCCDLNAMTCCDKDGNEIKDKQRVKFVAWETFNRGECSLNDVQLAWKEENCPCFVKRVNDVGVDRFGCSTDCPGIDAPF